MFTQPCFIRRNTPELREELESLEIYEHPSGKATGACLFANRGFYSSLPIGYAEEVDRAIDCGTNEKLFLALAALRDDYDMDQWFVYREEGKEDIWFICDWAHIEEWRNDASTRMSYQGASLYQSHKATPKELIEHFKE